MSRGFIHRSYSFAFFWLFVTLVRFAADNLVLTLIHIEKCVEFVKSVFKAI